MIPAIEMVLDFAVVVFPVPSPHQLNFGDEDFTY